MQVYHKEKSFPHEDLLRLFVVSVKGQFWSLSRHAKERILERVDHVEKIGTMLRDYILTFDDILEYTLNNGHIEKVLVRIDFDKDNDLIFSVSYDAKILTVYLNKKADKHFTLNKLQYV
jgi:hypothetical protein